MTVTGVGINKWETRSLKMGKTKQRGSTSIKTCIRAYLNHKQHFTEGPTAFAQNLIWRHGYNSGKRENKGMNISCI